MPQTVSVRADVLPADIVSFWCGRTHWAVDSYSRNKSGAECARPGSFALLTLTVAVQGMDGSMNGSMGSPYLSVSDPAPPRMATRARTTGEGETAT